MEIQGGSKPFRPDDQWVLDDDKPQKAASILGMRTSFVSSPTSAPKSYMAGPRPIWTNPAFQSEFVRHFVVDSREGDGHAQPERIEKLLVTLDLVSKMLAKLLSPESSPRVKAAAPQINKVFEAVSEARKVATGMPIGTSNAVEFQRLLRKYTSDPPLLVISRPILTDCL